MATDGRSAARQARKALPAHGHLESQSWLHPSMRLTIRLVLIARRWRSLLDERLRLIGQSSARMEALWAIAYSPPASPQIEIARRIGIEGATLTRMLDTLEADRLIARVADPSDRRSKHIRITDKGREALDEIMAIANAMRAHLVEGLPETAIDEANAFLADILGRIETLPETP